MLERNLEQPKYVLDKACALQGNSTMTASMKGKAASCESGSSVS